MKRTRILFLLVGIVIILGKSTNRAEFVSVQRAEAQTTDSSIYLPITVNSRIQNQSLFGVQVYGSFNSTTKYHNSFVQSGAEWIRNSASWEYTEPENVSPAEYIWYAVDSSLAASRRDEGAYQIIATIGDNPDWAASTNFGPIDQVPLTKFTEFVGALVERYDGDGVDDAPGSPVVEYWEFYNEPDNRDFWGYSPDKYAEMLAAVHPVMKAANPNAKVVFGGVAHDWFENQGGPFVEDFLDQVLANGGGPYFDVMNFHTYASFNHFWGSQGLGLIEKTNAIRSVLSRYGHGNKLMVITETGWHSDSPAPYPSNQEIQARHVTEIYVQSIAADINVAIWWMLYDPGSYWYDMGLVSNENPPQPKLALSAYKTAISQLANSQYIRTLPVAETGSQLMEAYEFKKLVNNQKFYTIWLNPMESEDHMQLALPHAQVALRDIVTGSIVGTVLDQDDGSIDGKVTIDVSSRPIYVEVVQ